MSWPNTGCLQILWLILLYTAKTILCFVEHGLNQEKKAFLFINFYTCREASEE